MKLELKSKETASISRSPIVQQTAFWAKVKKKHGIESKAFDIKVRTSDIFNTEKTGTETDDILILFPRVGDGMKIGYVPYGPTLKPAPEYEGAFLEELSESLRPHIPRETIMLRYDLLWESLWARDEANYSENGSWMGPPPRKSQEIRLNYDTQNWNLKKANTNILPTDTIFIDLTGDEEQLLQNMRHKTRYNIRLARRKGVTIRTAGLEDLPVWYRLYSDTCRRNHIHLDSLEYFKAVLETRAVYAKSPVKIELLIAELEGDPLAAMFLVYSQNRATYLYGASSSSNRNAMATYALQWEAIIRAKGRGLTEYDMFGVSPFHDESHPLYGLYQFKKGFGGDMFHRMGCWDYPLQMSNYGNYLTAEMKSTGYHL